MNYLNIQVPKEVDFISNWNTIFDQINFNGHIIVNKTVTGCGFTEFFINNNIPTILCSPRKILLENKFEQHPNVYLVRNELERQTYIDQDMIKNKKQIKDKDENIDNTKYICSLKDEIINYISLCVMSQVPPKILVTYDSLKHVLEAVYYSSLRLDQFQVVVDEFQSIFMDASFKASTELSFMDYLQHVPNVCYLSATPMMKEYLEQMDEFKDLPYYELNWAPEHLIQPTIKRKKVKSLSTACINIINEYLIGKYPVKCLDGITIHESKEVVFYVNSVKEIIKIISKVNKDNIILNNTNTNIICSDTITNKQSLKKIGFNIGSVPLKGKPHKMFTFCTRTVYLGADFYSTCASTVICSNVNIDCLALDISLDLPQIMGRQRQESNVFRNEAILFYLYTEKTETKEELEARLKEKKRKTDSIIEMFNNLTDFNQINDYIEMRRDLVLSFNYKKDYVGISEKTGIPTYNKLVELQERRAWEIQQLNYKDEVAIYNSLKDQGFFIDQYKDASDSEWEKFIFEFSKETRFPEKMKLYCEYAESAGGNKSFSSSSKIPTEFHTYYNFISYDKMKSVRFIECELKKIISDALLTNKIALCIYGAFSIGDRLYRRAIVDTLQEIYNTVGLDKKALATDILEYFEVKEVSFKEKITKKRIRGFELLNKKKLL